MPTLTEAGIDRAAFAQQDHDAEARYSQTADRDPLPDVAPALLNTRDLCRYVRETGMISPFRLDEQDPSKYLKPASCGIALGGEYQYWDNDSKLHSGTIEPGGSLTIEPNSIVFVTLEPVFRLPEYIAARFNLKIQHVYQGLLVGTGPLVDPGFNGRLHIPLHNLTNSKYELRTGEPLVWMEFTKLSPLDRWSRGADEALPTDGDGYVPFPRNNRNRKQLKDYLHDANGANPIESSIPSSIERSRKAAERARDISVSFSIGGAVLLIIALFGVILPTISLVRDSSSDARANARDLAKLEGQVAELERELSALEARQTASRSNGSVQPRPRS